MSKQRAIKDFQQLSGSQKTIADLLAMSGAENIELEIPVLRDLALPADLSCDLSRQTLSEAHRLLTLPDELIKNTHQDRHR
jgi:hypothetical protein